MQINTCEWSLWLPGSNGTSVFSACRKRWLNTVGEMKDSIIKVEVKLSHEDKEMILTVCKSDSALEGDGCRSCRCMHVCLCVCGVDTHLPIRFFPSTRLWYLMWPTLLFIRLHSDLRRTISLHTYMKKDIWKGTST